MKVVVAFLLLVEQQKQLLLLKVEQDYLLYPLPQHSSVILTDSAGKWTGSGNLPIIGGAAESRTYDYSDELLQPFTQVDNGLISAATTTTDDNGNIILPTTAGEEDNGSILNTVITPAQGTYTVSGATAVVARSSYVGTGSLFTAGGAAEVVAQTDDTTGLFTVSGVADTIRSRAYVGTGTLNALSGVAESRTWVYDRDLPAVLTSEDYGSVDASATSNEDQGQVSNPLTTGEVDYGEDGTLAHLTDPAHGTYTISGVANTPFERRYIGSGSYGGFSGTADDRFARFAIVDGFGTYTLFTAPAFIGNTYRFAFKFVGSGTLPVFGGLVESTTTNPPEDTVLFTGSGTAVERQADRWVGSGSLFTAGGVADTVTVNEAATGLFTVSGAGIEKHTERYIGTATAITLSGTAVERATQDYVGDTAQYTLSGSAVERESNAEVGSGSLFTTGGAAESKTSNPPESTVIFVVGGSKAESFTPATEVGSGSLFSVGGLVESHRQRSSNWSLYDQWSGCIQLYRRALLVLDLYSLLAGQQNRRPPTNQKAQFCLLHLELEQRLLQSEKYLSVELYLPSLVSSYRKSCSCRRRYNTIHLQWCSRVYLQSQISWFWYYQSTQRCCRSSCSCRRIYRTLRVPRKQGRILHTSTLHRIWFLRWILWNESFRETYRSILRNHTTICR